MKPHVFISAVGILNALGEGVNEVSAGLFEGSQLGITRSSQYVPNREVFLGAVRSALPSCPRGLEALWSRNAAFSILTVEQIRSQIDAVIAKYGADRIGVVMGSSTSGIDEGESAIRSLREKGAHPAGYSYAQQQMGTVSEVVSRYLGVSGPSYTISTACSSSAKVFRAARNLIQSGWCDSVITGGFDSLCKLTLNGFSALELVSDEVTNPFSKNRKGITIGEGGALFLLERYDGEVVPDDMVCIAGVGESSDAYHISSPDPTGAGATAAIQAALDQADVAPSDIDYVNLHGTGTLHNDAMEAQAIRSVFSDSIPCSSTKPLVGHMLGASGASEVAFCWMVLSDSFNRLPPHQFDGVMDPDLPALNFVAPGYRMERRPRIALSNSFGFGGSNCAVILRRGGE